MPLSHSRVLVVEDEMMVAMLVEDMLVELGHEVVGPAHRLNDAIEMAEREQFDFAILDVNLNGSQSFSVANILVRRGIPFAFATGYGALGIDARHALSPVISKPFSIDRLASVLTQDRRL